MLSTLPLLMMLADTPPTTQPRYREVPATQGQHEVRDPNVQGTPTDPLFDRAYVATDDPAFVLTAIENSRQAVVDARSASRDLGSAELRAAAEKIGAQNRDTTQKLEKLASARGWRLPQPNPARDNSVPAVGDAQAGQARANANFIVSQIAAHQNTLAQFQAQLAGNGDAELKRVLRESIPGYRANLELLLRLKP
ncbi:MAG TPA: DUF4142 domain-containing protein [Steroidobacteraceae bacterium]|nr:DUF4142 domain-containing protein [Steroidobacteraceae bacterium]